ncbi:MAG TPA: DUF5054 domain-containing protein, partial [Planctomycetota bacterium]|nr:DUF5054 domain-containing protein [Planctomycetota bacterium]
HGPQPIAEIKALFARLKTEYPSAKVIASNLNAYAAELMKYKRVPQYTKEIGDNWIRGVGTDPLKVAQLRSLLHLRRGWLAAGLANPAEQRFHAFSRQLMLVTEHTWGLDEKTHLNDFKNYEARDFARLRKTPAARKMERSWTEQRRYIQQGLQALGNSPLATEARAALKRLTPHRPDLHPFAPCDLATPLVNDRLSLRLDPATGAICHLTDRKKGEPPRVWADSRHVLGQLTYTAYSQADYDRYFRQYARDVHLHGGWIVPDLTKPGMPKNIRHREWTASLQAAYRREFTASGRGGARTQELLVRLGFPKECSHRFGAPRTVFVRYTLSEAAPQVAIQLAWFDKPATRLPEALWFGFAPKTTAAAAWQFRKLGVEIDPLQVTEHGGRQLHAVDLGVACHDGRDCWQLLTPDAPLVAPGREDMLDFSTRQPDMRHGVRVNLYNNTWGTNFPMWYDDDAQFRFVMGMP